MRRSSNDFSGPKPVVPPSSFLHCMDPRAALFIARHRIRRRSDRDRLHETSDQPPRSHRSCRWFPATMRPMPFGTFAAVRALTNAGRDTAQVEPATETVLVVIDRNPATKGDPTELKEALT